MNVYILKITTPIKINSSSLIPYVSKEKREKVENFFKEDDKLRSIYGELLIRYMVISELKINNSHIKFHYTKYGKPLLLEPHNIHFNISHCEKYVVCAIDNNPVGIDIEKIETIDFIDIANKFFTKDEANYIYPQSEINTLEESTNKFYEIWTLKESFIKCIGLGLSLPLNSFSVNFDKNENNKRISFKGDTYFFEHFDIENEYKLSICFKTPDTSIHINHINEYELTYKFTNNLKNK